MGVREIGFTSNRWDVMPHACPSLMSSWLAECDRVPRFPPVLGIGTSTWDSFGWFRFTKLVEIEILAAIPPFSPKTAFLRTLVLPSVNCNCSLHSSSCSLRIWEAQCEGQHFFRTGSRAPWIFQIQGDPFIEPSSLKSGPKIKN